MILHFMAVQRWRGVTRNGRSDGKGNLADLVNQQELQATPLPDKPVVNHNLRIGLGSRAIINWDRVVCGSFKRGAGANLD